jgi:hypothetical protein
LKQIRFRFSLEAISIVLTAYGISAASRQTHALSRRGTVLMDEMQSQGAGGFTVTLVHGTWAQKAYWMDDQAPTVQILKKAVPNIQEIERFTGSYFSNASAGRGMKD